MPHFDTVHEGRPPFKKGQTKLNLLGSPSAKTSVSQNENLTSSSEDLRHSRSGSIEPLSPPGSPVFIFLQLGATQCEHNDVLIVEMKNLLDQLELNVCTPRVDISVPATVSHQSKTKSKVHPESSRTLSHAIKEDKFTRQLNLLLETSCLKHIETLLDDVFELNLERTEILHGQTIALCYPRDKGTVKRDVTQPTLTHVVSLNKNNLFQKFFLSHPQVSSQVRTLLDSCCLQLLKL